LQSSHISISPAKIIKTMLKTVKDITNDYKIEQQKPNFGRRFCPHCPHRFKLAACQACFLAVIDVAFPLLLQGKNQGGTEMANTDEDQPDVLKEILKMQQETHKLIQQMAQDVRRLKNELGLRDVMR
jgi:hypothetical protein